MSANLDDLLQAFQCLDSSDQIPPIYCEAFDLPSLSLDPIAKQVKSNSLLLKSLTSSIENLSPKLDSFGSIQHPVAAKSFASAVSSGGQPTLFSSSQSKHFIQHSAQVASSPNALSQELNLVLFGLKETSSVVEPKTC